MDDHYCPLCCANTGPAFFRQGRDFHQCPVCKLVSVPASQFLSAESEKAHYDLHENSPADTGYRAFLSRLLHPMLESLSLGDRGLDFGSGPGPTLSVMLEEYGFPTAIYDPFYAPNVSVFEQAYEFITATEVVEHLHHPLRELQRLWGCLKPGGVLGIMTKRVTDQQAFRTWHYKDDPTHVCFFSVTTFEWLANFWTAEMVLSGADVVLFHKPVLECDSR